MTRLKGICKQCGEMKLLSSRGLCQDCASANINSAIEQMKNRKGPIYRKWKKARIRGDRKV